MKKNEHNYFYRAIRKYGENNFSVNLIDVCDELTMYDKEKYYISQRQSFNSKIGYNTNWSSAGSSGILTRDVRTRLSESSKAYWSAIPKEERSRMISNRLKGVLKSESHKRNLSKSKTGIKKDKSCSKFRGVSSCSKGGYRSTFCYGNGCSLTVGGTTTTEQEAAYLWDVITYHVHNDTTKLNFPERELEYKSIKLHEFLKKKFHLPKCKYKHISLSDDGWYSVWQLGKFVKKTKNENEAIKIACQKFECNKSDLIRVTPSLNQFLFYYDGLSCNPT